MLYEPRIKILSTNVVYRITLDEEKAFMKNFIRLSSFIMVEQDLDWKIILRPMHTFSTKEMIKIGVDWTRPKNRNKFTLPEGTTLESHLIFQNCYKNHADIFNLIEQGIALDIGTY